MLIEFSVSNFRSFRERQTFSMVAAPRLKKKNNTFSPDVVGERLPELLKIAAIYGPNASGKSNLLYAFEAVRSIAHRKPLAEHQTLPVAPFRFDSALSEQPSTFEIHFIKDGCRYEFVLSATKTRIVYERLTSYPKGKETPLYERNRTDAGDTYNFGDKLEGGSELHEAWRKLTGPQMLFIAQAVANSSEELRQLRAPMAWLLTGVMVVGQELRTWATFSQKLANDVPKYASHLSSFLHSIDVPVSGISFEKIEDKIETERPGVDVEPHAASDDSDDGDVLGNFRNTKTTIFHKTALGEAAFTFSEESAGTRNLIGFWLPWTLLCVPSDKSPRTVFVDELDSSLHPLIVASLVEQHQRSEQHTQLIFTTHDTHLMDSKLLRRDQFWLTERDANGATKLRSVHDFEGREGEDIEKRYFEGRYRGLPILRKRIGHG